MKRTTYLFRAIASQRQEALLRRRRLERKRKDELKLLVGNEEFKGIYQGRRCFIIGNGPSVRDVDFSLLKDEIVFTVNQLPRLERFRELETNFHLWADERFFNLSKDDEGDMELLNVMKSVKTESNSPIVFYKTNARKMVEEYNLREELNIRYFMDGLMGNGLSSIDYPLTRMMPVFPTCIHYAIIIAVYMGFSKIYLLGCDCTGIQNTINARMASSKEFFYAYEVSENEKQRMLKVSQLTKLSDEFKWYGELLELYEVLGEYAKAHGTELYNATSTTLIENLPRVGLEEVLNDRG